MFPCALDLQVRAHEGRDKTALVRAGTHHSTQSVDHAEHATAGRLPET